MNDRDFNRQNVPAIDDLLNGMEQMRVPEAGTDELVRCDLCSSPVFPNKYMESYVSNRELVTEATDLAIQRLYCAECAVGRVKYPCTGVLEIIISGTLDRNRQYQDLKLEDYSIPQDGYAWDPVEVSEEVFKMPIEFHAEMTGGMKIGPEDIVDALHHMDIDIRDVLDENDNVSIDEDTENMIHKKMMEKVDEYKSGGGVM